MQKNAFYPYSNQGQFGAPPGANFPRGAVRGLTEEELFWRTRLPSPFPCHTHGLAAKCTQRLFGAISASAMTTLVRLSFAGGRSGACRKGGACCLPLCLSRSLVRAWRANANCFRFASFFS